MADRSEATREKLLAAALAVYGRGGSRAATTRRIAAEAAVNEVTLFRHFQGKDQLLEAALAQWDSDMEEFELPSRPRSPRAELISWSAQLLAQLRERAAVIRTCIAEAGERPDAVDRVTATPRRAVAALIRYVRALREGVPGENAAARDTLAAGLVAALFADAMARDVLPEMLPGERQVPAWYVDRLLAALGVGEESSPVARARAAPPPSLPDATGA